MKAVRVYPVFHRLTLHVGLIFSQINNAHMHKKNSKTDQEHFTNQNIKQNIQKQITIRKGRHNQK